VPVRIAMVVTLLRTMPQHPHPHGGAEKNCMSQEKLGIGFITMMIWLASLVQL